MTVNRSSGYHSPRRQEQAQETRRRIIEAAARLFTSHGYGAVSLKTIAREAGVSEPTIYATFGNKSSLALALVELVDERADPGQGRSDLEAAGTDPRRQLAAMVAFDRRLFERGGEVIALLRDAGRSEPDLAAAYQAGRQHGRAVQERVISSWAPGVLRDGLTSTDASDTYAALSNYEVFRVLTEERGWSPDHFEHWLLASLELLLLSPAG